MRAVGTLFIISAPSGAGKTTLVSALLEKTPDLEVSVSHTTRPRRSKEANGENYFFVDEATFEQMMEENAFLESARVFGNYYGTSREWVEQKLASGTDVILEIDWQGAELVRKSFPKSVSIFIIPPSIATLKERLNRRNQDQPEVIARRVAEAKLEISHYQTFEYLVVNRHFPTALSNLSSIIQAERLRINRQQVEQAALLRGLLDEPLI